MGPCGELSLQKNPIRAELPLEFASSAFFKMNCEISPIAIAISLDKERFRRGNTV